MTLLSFFALTLTAMSLSLGAAAQAMIVPAPPAIAASSYILIDANSGAVLMSGNADERIPPASLSKLMTAYVAEVELAAGRLNLNDRVRISEKAWRTGGSKMFVLVNDEVRVEDLMRGIVIQSGNDASIAIAEHVAGDEANFAIMMNQFAQQMGMQNTRFGNATGLPASMTELDPGYTTARDMVILARHKIKDHPQFYLWHSEQDFTFAGITQANRNRLLWQNPAVDGLKTGFTADSGYSLVASAEQDGMRLITAVMGAATAEVRFTETQKMLGYGFRFFETPALFDAHQSIREVRVWGGAQDMLQLGLPEDLFVTIPRGARPELRQQFTLIEPLNAPIEAGDVMGRIIVTHGDQVLADEPLLALHAVARGGLMKRGMDRVRRLIHDFRN